MRAKSLIDEARQIRVASELIELGARLQVLEAETTLSRERLRVTYAITLPQFDVMAALYRRSAADRPGGGMTMTELSRFLMVSNGNVTGIIDRLVTDGLVVRRDDAEDRRAVLVELTARGAERFSEMARVHETWVDDLLSEFTKAEAEELIGHLDGLADRIRKGGRRA